MRYLVIISYVYALNIRSFENDSSRGSHFIENSIGLLLAK